MPHVTVEYVILAPMLIAQIFLFPLAANWLMNIWVDSRRALALQDYASHLGSTVQQLYYSLIHTTIQSGAAKYSPGLPPLIENLHYRGNATLRVVSGSVNSSRVLHLTLKLVSTSTSVATLVTLGPSAKWLSSTFFSNSSNACIMGQKLPNGTILMQFGG